MFITEKLHNACGCQLVYFSRAPKGNYVYKFYPLYNAIIYFISMLRIMFAEVYSGSELTKDLKFVFIYFYKHNSNVSCNF